MLINLNTQSNTSFGQIKYFNAATIDNLKKSLNLKNLKELHQIRLDRESNDFVDLYFLYDRGILQAKIADNKNKLKNSALYECKDYTQKLFQSKMHFIRAMAKKLDKRTQQIKQIIEKESYEI
jgi:hypothetical protein